MRRGFRLLLIEPFGIETGKQGIVEAIGSVLLIEPFGIETGVLHLYTSERAVSF